MTTTVHPQTPQQAWALKMLATAKGYVGTTRTNDKKQITKFLNLFGLDFADENGKPYPFCAAGASWCGLKALAQIRGISYVDSTIVQVLQSLIPDFEKNHFKPSASCGVMIDDAKERGNWYGPTRPAHLLQPGWLVFYDFAKTGHAQHVEIIDQATPDALSVVGFNTADENNANGGAVAMRTRGYGSVFGYLKTY